MNTTNAVFRASAPGKIILFGEHAVVYGRPALAAPLMQVAASVEITAQPRNRKTGKPENRPTEQLCLWLDAPDIGLSASLEELLQQATPPPLAIAIRSVCQALGVEQTPRLRILVSSSIPLASGLGSGAAVSVALIRALSAALGQPLPDERVNALAYEIEKLYHGTPSGVDNTVITYARPVYFVRGQVLQPFRVTRPVTLVIGDSGIAAPTKESVGAVRRLWQADPARWEKVFDRVAEIVEAAKSALESGELSRLGPLMDENHALLQAMTVSSAELDRLVAAAKTVGAQGAKLSGGGRGGNMIALSAPEKAEAVAAALRLAGARHTIISTIE
ncbi:MAG: mevalonate kinase [Anaerolineales bacterium]